MSVTTSRIMQGIYKGSTKVRIRAGCTNELVLVYRNRGDAVQLLKALRKRER